MYEFNGSILLSGKIVDEDAHAKSARTDPQIDREYFMNNPGEVFRLREASQLEKRAYGLEGSPTAITEVKLETDGVLFRTRRLTWDPARGKRPPTKW